MAELPIVITAGDRAGSSEVVVGDLVGGSTAGAPVLESGLDLLGGHWRMSLGMLQIHSLEAWIGFVVDDCPCALLEGFWLAGSTGIEDAGGSLGN